MKELEKAFVLVGTEIRKEEKVRQEIEKISGVKEVYLLYGVHDLLVKVEAPTKEKVREIVIWHIRTIPEVRYTLTYLVVPPGVLAASRRFSL